MASPLHRVRFGFDHRWAPPHMSDYLDGELSFRSRRRMESHVGECEECRRLLAGLREMLRALQGLAMPTPVEAGEIAAAVRLRIQGPGSP
jgi:anti-sigma factor RsiW